MRKLLFFAVYLLCLVVPGVVAADTITLVADEWCPYNCTPGSERPGFMIEIAESAFGKHGDTVEYKVMPWSRALEETRSGKYTGIVGAYRNDAPDFLFPDAEVLTAANYFYIKADDTWRYTSFASLDDVSLGVIRDYSYGAELDGYIKLHKSDMDRVQIVSGEDALRKNIDKLLYGRIRVIVEDRAVMTHYLKQQRHSKEIIEAGSLGQGKIYIAFSPKLEKASQYAKTLSEEIVRLRKSGELQIILKKYGVE